MLVAARVYGSISDPVKTANHDGLHLMQVLTKTRTGTGAGWRTR